MSHHSQEAPSNFAPKFSPALFRSALILLTLSVVVLAPQRASGQRSPGFGGLSGATLKVNIVSSNGTSIEMPAVVTLFPMSGSGSPQQQSADDGTAQFQNLKEGSYSVGVTMPGYKNAKQDVEISTLGVAEASVVMESDDVQPDAPGMLLAPKPRKEIDDGIAALHASKYDEAQKQFEAAYKLAPGDPDVNDALGLLYLVKKDTQHAQEYISRALSLDPNDVNALVDDGQLKLIQQDFKGAQPQLEKAVALAPHNYFAHWLLGIGYFGTRQYEKARVEALAAIKASKDSASDAEYLLGQSLAGLGRNAEAIMTLQKFVGEEPNGFYTPAAKTLLAKLRNPPSETVGEVPDVAGGPLAQNAAASTSPAAH